MEPNDKYDDCLECTICLEPLSEPAITQPCGHINFDFICIVTWLQSNHTCPLCKTQVRAVRHNIHKDEFDLYEVKSIANHLPRNQLQSRSTRPFLRRRYPRSHAAPLLSADESVEKRRQVYRQRTYSRHVGSNRISGYREITHVDFQKNEHLVGRAKKWIRRELKVFDFLNPTTADASLEGPKASSSTDSRSSNAEFLLSYIVAILKTVDIKGLDGQAENLLTDYLGREDSSLFLHELRAFLRSPYETLEAWDSHVQYDLASSGDTSGRSSPLPGDDKNELGRELHRRRRTDSYRPSRHGSYAPVDRRSEGRSFRVEKNRR